VKELSAALTELRTLTIPQLASQVLGQLRQRELDYQRRIQGASKELEQIPPRTIEEMRLNRAVIVAEGLYTNLKNRHAEAKLAEASASPDISVLDTAVAPLTPAQSTAPRILLMAIFGGLGVAVALALFLDQMDGRFRYVEQAANELGLVIAGTVPRIPKKGLSAKAPEHVVQFVESFRTLRMHVMHSLPDQRLSLSITSAGPSDGKSLVSSNLALSFAEVGLRTVLVDGDTRRGNLHRMFGLTARDGLTEFLAGAAKEADVVRATPHANLSFVSCGRRHPRSPEMLATPRLKQLVDYLTRSFDVVILDTPPLAAGIDGYAISAAAGNSLMVIRMGQTQRRLATTKLSVLDRLPVDVLGAVLNGVQPTGEFQYYAYTSGYSIEDHVDPAGELVGDTAVKTPRR
jgi:capsular exopolysaccharide synthesis family protein